MKDLYKIPRLYTEQDLKQDQTVSLTTEQAHYLNTVLRLSADHPLRLFNGRDGEWLTHITTLERKSGALTPIRQTREQTAKKKPTRLLFAPIKKTRLNMLIEKAVELGVDELHPVITERTENRKLNIERIETQIKEAAEQCERLEIPTLHTPKPLKGKLGEWSGQTPLYWASERDQSAPHLSYQKNISDFLIGPEGGFTDNEHEFLDNHSSVHTISLGTAILRAETAAIFCLSHVKLNIDTA